MKRFHTLRTLATATLGLGLLLGSGGCAIYPEHGSNVYVTPRPSRPLPQKPKPPKKPAKPAKPSKPSNTPGRNDRNPDPGHHRTHTDNTTRS